MGLAAWYRPGNPQSREAQDLLGTPRITVEISEGVSGVWAWHKEPSAAIHQVPYP